MNRPLRLPAAQAGFTLIEIMIGAAIGMVVLFATLSVFDTTNRARTALAAGNEVFQTGAFALHTLQSDLKLAGFYGEGRIDSSVLPSSAPDPCSTASADWQAALPLAAQGWIAGNGTRPTCLPSTVVEDSSIIAVRRASTCVVGQANCSAGADGTPLIQLSQCADEATPAQTGTSLGALTLKGRGCENTAPVRQFYTRIYYLDENNVPGDGIRTLKRMELSQGSMKTVTVAQGVEQLQVRYGLDLKDRDGVIDVWTEDPTNEPGCGESNCPILNWTHVMEVKVYMLLKGAAAEPGRAGTGTKTYTLGDMSITPADDGYRRTVVGSAVRLVNLSGARE